MSNDVYDMNREQFIAALADKIHPEYVYRYAESIYGLLTGLFQQDCGDSVLREWAFQWASDEMKIDYDVIYDKWLRS